MSKSGRTAAEVENDVKERAANAADHLRLLVRRQLIMHAAQRARCCTQGIIDLSKMTDQSMLLKFILVKQAREEAAIIASFFDVNEVGAGEGGWGKDHNQLQTVARAWTH